MRKIPGLEVPGHKVAVTEDQLATVKTMPREWLVVGRKITHAGQSTSATPTRASLSPAQQ